MEKIRRNERMSIMMKVLSDRPGRLFSLNSFCEMFASSKSTVSEDVDALRRAVKDFDLGEIETVTGSAGGVLYRPGKTREACSC